MFFYQSLWDKDLYIFLKKISFYSSFFIIVLIFPFSNNVQAFELIPLFPENQIKKDVNYYDLRVHPGQEQTLDLLVRNTEDVPVTLYFHLTTAMTNNLGTVDYLLSDEEYVWDESLPFQLSDIVVIPNEITVPPKSEGLIPIHLQMPETSFEGMFLGAIEVQSDSHLVSQMNDTMQIHHKVRYLILMKLTETDQKVMPDIIWQGIDYDSSNHSLILKIRNPVGAYIFNLGIHIVIQTPNNEVIFEKNIQQLEMAPYSYLDYIVSLDEVNLEADTPYKILLTLISDDDQKYIEEIFNYTDHNQEHDQNFMRYKLKLLILIILLIASIVVVIIIKKIRKDVV